VQKSFFHHSKQTFEDYFHNARTLKDEPFVAYSIYIYIGFNLISVIPERQAFSQTKDCDGQL